MSISRRQVVALLTASLVIWPAPTNRAQAVEKSAAPRLPDSFDAVAARVRRHLASQRGYQPGDVITRKQAVAALDEVQSMGWDLAKEERQALLARVLDDRAFLCQQLTSDKGKLLVRKSAQLPGVYDKLDRLSQMPQGHDLIQKLVRGPDGHKLLEYLMQTKGGAEMERMLSKAPTGRNIGRATGTIYEESMLLVELNRLYEEQKKRVAAK